MLNQFFTLFIYLRQYRECVLAAELSGMKEVPVIRLEHLSKAKAKAFMIADNRLCEIASWNEDLLAEHLKDLASIELDFSIEATGFTMGEIDLRIEEYSTHKEGPEDAPLYPHPTG